HNITPQPNRDVSSLTSKVTTRPEVHPDTRLWYSRKRGWNAKILHTSQTRVVHEHLPHETYPATLRHSRLPKKFYLYLLFHLLLLKRLASTNPPLGWPRRCFLLVNLAISTLLPWPTAVDDALAHPLSAAPPSPGLLFAPVRRRSCCCADVEVEVGPWVTARFPRPESLAHFEVMIFQFGRRHHEGLLEVLAQQLPVRNTQTNRKQRVDCKYR
ncbi:unnamed protein product, partial [Ectocarpus sp. 6 AP-2014]